MKKFLLTLDDQAWAELSAYIDAQPIRPSLVATVRFLISMALKEIRNVSDTR